ncbi:fatty acid cis/trans isomerase [Aliarcobacter faecis]|uniref:fatty acid cis/trans isomerase n=1 Tax=Aliarcobacter faecis TaxID=1564138 RepID=UPI000478D6E5|nr:fatty acid cis/trans isomerase [Aliarcobacter faecis]QKF74124.1 fatty acid cis/trans isomerase [Aliarcobacter faecis]
MKLQILIILLFTLLFTACSNKELDEVEFEKVQKNISYEKDIKPILDNRCVSCHSCYNSPCQLKLDSYEGLERGSSKDEVYATRLNAAQPTRLFIDALSTNDWRAKNFSSVLDKDLDSNESIMMQFLFQKELNPQLKGNYSPETDKLTCVKNRDELENYLNENPHKAMPYGFPGLTKEEYNTIMTWLDNGSLNDTKESKIPNFEEKEIKKFEDFLNNPDIKHKVTARYIYEHLFLAHIYFFETSGNFYELIRSTTPSGEKPQIIATRFPYDEVKEPFYYRLQKVNSTIVHKTHMVYKIDDEKLKFYNDIFIKPEWEEEPYLPSYNEQESPNALEVFKQIPALSRYEFMLKDIYFIINTFIKGPVCKGQIALNVIQDHFWVAFMDPKYDLSVIDKNFLKNNFENLKIPNQLGEDPSLFQTFKNLGKEKETKDYQTNRAALYKKHYKDGLKLNYLRNSPNNDSILTVYRHFDSASLHKGALGNIPKTLWVIDFPLLERIYYSLVAGFDVFGNTAHQLLVRTHMDRLRVEGESNFLEFLPQKSRIDYFNSWYIGWLAKYLTVYTPSENETGIKFETKDYKFEFVKNLLAYTNTKKDEINFVEKDYEPIPLKPYYNTKEEIQEALKSLSTPNVSKVIQHFIGAGANTANIRILLNNKENLNYTLVVNRWHKNIALMFDEKSRLDPTKDDIDFIEGFIGSYPNIFVYVNQDDLNDFFDLIQNYENTPIYNKKFLKYTINRANPNFWQAFDYFNKEFQESNPLEYGILDLNKYYEKVILETGF